MFNKCSILGFGSRKHSQWILLEFNSIAHLAPSKYIQRTHTHIQIDRAFDERLRVLPWKRPPAIHSSMHCTRARTHNISWIEWNKTKSALPCILREHRTYFHFGLVLDTQSWLQTTRTQKTISTHRLAWPNLFPIIFNLWIIPNCFYFLRECGMHDFACRIIRAQCTFRWSIICIITSEQPMKFPRVWSNW